MDNKALSNMVEDSYLQRQTSLLLWSILEGFEDLGDAWRQKSFYETPDLVEMTENLWQEIKPLYVQLHSYVRRKLRAYYVKNHPEYDFPNDGSIPAHLLGMHIDNSYIE